MLWAKMLAGALIGGAVGILMGRARVCHSPHCHARLNMLASIAAAAVFGAAAAYYFAGR
jgi:hypothetical protein